MSTSTLVSVIIPNFNYSIYLTQCINSVLKSNFNISNIEIIVVDDASTDNSVAIVQEMMQNISSIRLIQNDTNLGLTRSRNRGIVNAKGNYLFFLDADNYITEGCINAHTSILDHHPEFSACYAPCQEFLNETNELLLKRSNDYFNYQKLLYGNYIDAMAMFRKKDIVEVGMYDLMMPTYFWEDYELWLRFGKLNKKIHFINGNALSFYRIHKNNLSSKITNYNYNILIHYLRLKYDLKIELFDTEEENRKTGLLSEIKQTTMEQKNTLLNKLIQKDELFQKQEKRLAPIQYSNDENLNKINDLTNQPSMRTNELKMNKKGIIFKLARNLSKHLQAILKKRLLHLKNNSRSVYSNIRIIRQSGLFDEKYYLESYPDVAEAGINSLKHYLLFGGFEGRNPNPDFISNSYLEKYSDVKLSNINPLLHYIKHGNKEGRNSLQKNNSINFLKLYNPIIGNQMKFYSQSISSFISYPLISIITPVYNVDSIWLDKCIHSVLRQNYDKWELCIIDDGSTNNDTLHCLKGWQNIDPRINISYNKINQNISKSSNIAIQNATGEFIAFLDNDDELKEDALFWIVYEINKHPEADLIYTDECKITSENKLIDFNFKPDWSPEFLLNEMYIGHLSVYRKSIIEKVGLFRSEYDFSQDYDLALRVSEITQNIFHVERILYYWRQIKGSAAGGGKDYARKSNIAALEDALKRRNVNGKVIEYSNVANRVKISINSDDKVSIIIPSDSFNNLKNIINNIIDKTTYENYEIIIVTKSSLIYDLKKIFKPCPENLIFSPYDKNFNFSDKCNQGANDSNGRILIFQNDDVNPLINDWIENLIEFLYYDKKIGSVSPMLLWENGTIQYAGMTTNVNPFCGTFLNGRDKNEDLANKVRNTSILSGACFAIWKEVFNEVGAFNSINTPAGHSDLDLSFKLRDKGYRCVYTPYSTLSHIGNHSWHTKKDKADIYILRKWGKYISNDPYYTKSMRAMIDGYLPEQFGIFSSEEYYKPYSFDALIVLQELSVTGSSTVVLETAKAIRNKGGYPVIFSYVDGPYRKEFEKLNISVIVNNFAITDDFSFIHFAKNFDIIIANTVVVYPAIHMIQDLVPTIWYIHEAENIESFFIPHFNNEALTLKDVLIGTNSHVYVASEYSKNIVKKYNNNVRLLKYGIDDLFLDNEIIIGDEIQFSIVGTIEERKAQDVFIQAIMLMPIEYQKKAIFNIIGNEDNEKIFVSDLKKRSKHISNIKWHGLITDQKDKLELFINTSLFVVISRDEPVSVVVIEAAMLGKPSIISENVGAKYMVEDGKNGFIVKTGDSEHLKDTLMKIIDDPSILIGMGNESRKKYLQTSTLDIFQSNLIEAIKDIIEVDAG